MFRRMSTGGRMLVLGISVALAACPALASERTEAVLSWDDGDPDAFCGADRVAVWFQAPGWATHVVAVHVWFGGESSPMCTVWLNRASGEWPYLPGPPANSGLHVDQVPGGTWAVLPLPDPVDITNAGHFPDRVFFAGIEFETQSPDAVGVDTDPPVHGKSFVCYWGDCDWYGLGDLMIRAVVSDITGSAVEVLSWGAVKHAYGESRLPN